MGSLPGVWVPPQQVRELRQLLAYRESLVRDRVRANNRAKATLRRYGIRIPQEVDPVEWLGDERLDLPEAARVIVASSLKQAQHLQEEITAITQEIIRRIAPHRRARQLMSLPGFGPVVTAAVIALVGDPTRFRRAKQVSRFAGLDPSVHQSGETDRCGRISKNGAALLRKLLIQAAYQLVRTGTGPLAEFYRRKAATLGGKRAIVAVARKLLIAAWRLWQTDRLADEVKLKTYQRKMRELDKQASAPAYPVSETLRGLVQNTDGSRDQHRAVA